MKLFSNNRKRIKEVGYFSNSVLLGRFAAALLLVTTLVFLGACDSGASEKAAEVGGVTAKQIIENPSAYIGKTVTVSGDVEEIHGPRAFNMDSGLSIGELLVVGREPFPQIPEAGDRAYLINDVATVTGTVKMFVTADIEREIGWDLDPQLEAEYNGKPVLVVQKVQFRPGASSTATIPANTSQSVNSGQTMMNSNSSPNNDVVDVLMIIAAPDAAQLIGKRVQLPSVKVQEVIGDRTFYVGPSESQKVLIVFEEEKTPNTPMEGKIDVTKGQTVAINGVVKKMPPAAEAKAMFGKLLSESEADKFSNQKVYIATEDPKVIKKP